MARTRQLYTLLVSVENETGWHEWLTERPAISREAALSATMRRLKDENPKARAYEAEIVSPA